VAPRTNRSNFQPARARRRPHSPNPKAKGDAAPPCQRRRLPACPLPSHVSPRPTPDQQPPLLLGSSLSPRTQEGAVAWRRFQFQLSTALAVVFGFDDCPIKQQQQRRETRRSEKEAPFQGKGFAFSLNLAAPRLLSLSRAPRHLGTGATARAGPRERRSLCRRVVRCAAFVAVEGGAEGLAWPGRVSVIRLRPARWRRPTP